MKVVDVEQRTPEWHAWRAGGVSASELAIIMGLSPYKTPWRLWAEKTGRFATEDLSNNPHVRRGVENEDIARQHAETQLGDILLPLCAESTMHPIIRCSFDGLTSLNIPVELKCPSQKGFDEVKSKGDQADQVIKYRAQLMAQMLVAESDYAFMGFLSPDCQEFLMVRVERDQEMIDKMVVAGEKFHQCIVTDTPPAFDEERDLFSPSTDDDRQVWLSTAEEIRLLDVQLKNFEKAVKDLKARRGAAQESLQNLMGEFWKADFGGVSLTRFEKEGVVDYPRLIRENLPDIDVEVYRKTPSVQWRLTVTNKVLPKDCIDEEVAATLVDAQDGPLVSNYF